MDMNTDIDLGTDMDLDTNTDLETEVNTDNTETDMYTYMPKKQHFSAFN
jgi:hypothetical protein